MLLSLESMYSLLRIHPRTNSPRCSASEYKDKLDLPGGYVEKGETPEQAAVREFKEETGLRIKIIAQLKPVDYFDRQPKTSYTFIGKIVGGKLQNTEEGKPAWIDLNNINPADLSVPHQFIPIFNLNSKYKNPQNSPKKNILLSLNHAKGAAHTQRF